MAAGGRGNELARDKCERRPAYSTPERRLRSHLAHASLFPLWTVCCRLLGVARTCDAAVSYIGNSFRCCRESHGMIFSNLLSTTRGRVEWAWLVEVVVSCKLLVGNCGRDF